MAPTAKPKKTGAKKKAPARELITLANDKRYVRRNSEGQFQESDDVSRSLSLNRKRKAKTVLFGHKLSFLKAIFG
jgi:hypothetical protein